MAASGGREGQGAGGCGREAGGATRSQEEEGAGSGRALIAGLNAQSGDLLTCPGSYFTTATRRLLFYSQLLALLGTPPGPGTGPLGWRFGSPAQKPVWKSP